MNYIYSAMGWILDQLYNLLGAIWSPLENYALAIVVFTILVKIVFIPISINQQKSTAKQTAVRPKLDALKAKCGDDKQKYSVEMQELYRKENVKLMGGCLPQLVMLPFLWGVWQAIRSPLSYILHIDKTTISAAKDIVAEGLGKSVAKLTELDVVQNVKLLSGNEFTSLINGVNNMDFNFFGLDLTRTPVFSFNFSQLSGSDFALWIIPLLSFATAMISSVITMNMQKKTNPEASANMGCLMLSMPLMSLYFTFIVPAAVGFYWACSNVVTTIVQVILNNTLSPYKIIANQEFQNVKLRKTKEEQIMLNK